MNNQLFTQDTPVDGGQTPATMLRVSTEFTRETSAVAYVSLQTPESATIHDTNDDDDEDDEILSSLPWWGQIGFIVLMPAAAGLAISLDKLNMLPGKDTVYDKIANLLG